MSKTTETTSLGDLTHLETVDVQPSTSVARVKELPHVNEWSPRTLLAREYLSCFFTYRRLFFKMRGRMSKRIVLLDQRPFIIVYETNCTGYVFDLRNAKKVVTKSLRGSCQLTFKFKFGSFTVQLVGSQTNTWRKLLMSAYEGNLHVEENVTTTQTVSPLGEVLPGGEVSPISTCTLEKVGRALAEHHKMLESIPFSASLASLDKVTEKAMLDDITEEDISEKESETSEVGDKNEEPVQVHPKRSTTTAPVEPDELSAPTAMSTTSEVDKKNDLKSVRAGRMSVAMLRRRLEDRMKSTFSRTVSNKSDRTNPDSSQMSFGAQNNVSQLSSASKVPKKKNLEALFPPAPIRVLQATTDSETSKIERSEHVFKFPHLPKPTKPIVSMTSTTVSEVDPPTLPESTAPRLSGGHVYIHRVLRRLPSVSATAAQCQFMHVFLPRPVSFQKSCSH